jgi:hypothetical protein
MQLLAKKKNSVHYFKRHELQSSLVPVMEKGGIKLKIAMVSWMTK